MDKEFKQPELESQDKTLNDYIQIKDGRLVLMAPFETNNFLSGKRGVRIAQDGLNAGSGTVGGATIGGTATVIAGALTHTGSTAGFYNKAPTAQASDMVALTISAGTPDNTVADVGASFNQTTLNNNFADLATKINTIRTVLRNLGLMA